jgi:hypothetical protein
MHETQKPSISQGLYPIPLPALLALTTSAYTSLGVSQDLNPQCKLLKASVYHSATSAVGIMDTKRVLRVSYSEQACCCYRYPCAAAAAASAYAQTAAATAWMYLSAGAEAVMLPPLLLIYLFFPLQADGVVVSRLFLAADIGVMALSVATAIVLGAVVLQVETKIVPTTTRATTNKMHHSAPSTPPSNLCLREGKGEGSEGKSGGNCCGRW